MSSQDETFVGREQRLNAIVAEILEAREAGEKLSREAILDRHPEFARELKEFFENEPIFRGSFQLDRQLPCFGDDFEVLEIIGRGGMGVVYKAHQKSLNKVVAIKTIEGPSATPSEVERVHDEAQRVARLRHPNIVTVHQVAEHEGQHFFVMDYMEGGSLADRIHDGPLASSEAARYLKTLADAVHYAHQRQILHCDLKPANVLLDGAGNLCVTDFGLARQLDEAGTTSAVGGTLTYMAPEQTRVGEELTTATDVYGLGGILYALLTETTPFLTENRDELLRRVREERAERPRTLTPDVDEDLEAICLKCLEKGKGARYGSADALAEDVARYQTGEETTARSWNRRERLRGWFRRNPAVAGLLAAVVGISILTGATALSIAQARKGAQLAEAVQSNSFEAKEQATTALLQLRDWSDTTEVAADGPELSDLLARGDRDGLQRYLEPMCGAVFATCFVQDAEGVIVQRVRGEQPGPDPVTEEVFLWRDYFHGAKAHTGLSGQSAVHVSRVYRGRSDALYKFAFSAPIADENGRFLGVLSTSVTTNATMGIVKPEDPRRAVVLVAPKDVDSPETDSRAQFGDYAILFHPAYRRGVPAVDFVDVGRVGPIVQSEPAEELTPSDLLWEPADDYRDPVGAVLEEYQGRWIAGFAPVGNTGFVVIVQRRYEEALKLDPSLWRNLVAWSALVIGLAMAIMVVILRRTRSNTQPAV